MAPLGALQRSFPFSARISIPDFRSFFKNDAVVAIQVPVFDNQIHGALHLGSMVRAGYHTLEIHGAHGA